MKQTLNEKNLSMLREKKRSTIISFAYRLSSIGQKIFGKDRFLRFYLNSSWLFWRFAFELSGEIYGKDFHNYAKALNEDFLKSKIAENNTVIDIGCGVGRWCRIAAKYAKNVVGIDYDASLISIARQETKEKNVEYIVGDVTKDLDGRKFDLALLTHVIEHIEDADKMLQELHAVASNLIVEVPDFENDALNIVRLEQNCRFYSDGDHVREYTREILVNQLERNNWKVSETYKNGGAVLAVCTQNHITNKS
jgi:2-polyprenyl-3-methyl-5-hydroxy-6-metoxy-1,4-benzoquinol methylase